jgi:ParB family chromosome partitioning protein
MSYVGVIEQVNVKKIRHTPNQLRTRLDNLDELASSIEKHGLLQPIVVRPQGSLFEVVAGNRRFAAVCRL